ncbi:MAG: hypothetical protein ACI4AQ_10895 [Lachnospiraceae bacterium]
MRYLLCVVYVLFSVSGLTLIKIGSNRTIPEGICIPVIGMSVSKYTILGILCYGISFCLYLGVVSKFDLGIIIPILGGIVNILIVIISFLILKEKVTANMILGAVIISIGIIIMNIGKK